MTGYSTYLQKNSVIVDSQMPYTYSQSLSENFFWEMDTQPLLQTYDNSKNIMRGFRLLYNNKTGSTAMNLEQLRNLDKLYDISQLKENWNGYGSKPISKIVMDYSEIIIKNVCSQPTIYATGRDSIQMQYELNDRSYLEFEVFQEKIVCMKVPQRIYKKASFEIMKDVDMQLINKIIKEFYGR